MFPDAKRCAPARRHGGTRAAFRFLFKRIVFARIGWRGALAVMGQGRANRFF
jgi:hypothetical protein